MISEVLSGARRWHVDHSDCRPWLRSLPSASVDAIISDPPYPEIDRPYGRLTEVDWHALMRDVVAESRRVLKPRGSAVFILQPNSERVGRMRPWLWEFMAWTAREWNQVQDAWWWNTAALPLGGATSDGLLRPSAKACVWLGAFDCWRDQTGVLWEIAKFNAADAASARCARTAPSGRTVRNLHMVEAATRRGGSTPYNVIPIANANSTDSAGSEGHGAGTPLPLARWWTRYICPPGGVVCDPFMGVGTMARAALLEGRRAIGCEQMAEYHATAVRILETDARLAQETLPLAAPVREPDPRPLAQVALKFGGTP